jgi:hypothetical protein
MRLAQQHIAGRAAGRILAAPEMIAVEAPKLREQYGDARLIALHGWGAQLGGELAIARAQRGRSCGRRDWCGIRHEALLLHAAHAVRGAKA